MVVILNPAADHAGGRGPEIRKALDASGVKYELLRIERPLPVHMDGELFPEPTCELSVELLPQALSVLT